MYKPEHTRMDVIDQIDKRLNGDPFLMNAIFAYLGRSPSANIIAPLINWNYHEYFYTWWKYDFKPVVFETHRTTPTKLDPKRFAIESGEEPEHCEVCKRQLTYTQWVEHQYYDECHFCHCKRLRCRDEYYAETDETGSETGSETDED